MPVFQEVCLTLTAPCPYIFYADFFEKNSIFKIETKIGYEILNRTFFGL